MWKPGPLVPLLNIQSWKEYKDSSAEGKSPHVEWEIVPTRCYSSLAQRLSLPLHNPQREQILMSIILLHNLFCEDLKHCLLFCFVCLISLTQNRNTSALDHYSLEEVHLLFVSSVIIWLLWRERWSSVNESTSWTNLFMSPISFIYFSTDFTPFWMSRYRTALLPPSLRTRDPFFDSAYLSPFDIPLLRQKAKKVRLKMIETETV